MVISLLKEGGDVDVKDDVGATAFHNAALAGHIAVAEYLAEQGTDLGIRDKHGRIPLDVAKEQGHTAIVRYLEKVMCMAASSVSF